MKYLYFLRHAHSRDKSPGQGDKQRELSPSGLQQCVAVGNFIREKKYPVEIILTSTAERAAATAQLVAERVPFSPDIILPDEELYQASVRTMMDVIHHQDNYQHMMIVGHNPTISYFTEYITDEALGEMSPGGLLVIKSSIAAWRELSKGNAEVIENFHP